MDIARYGYEYRRAHATALSPHTSIKTIVFVFIRDLIYHNLSKKAGKVLLSTLILQTGVTDCFRRGRRLPYLSCLSVPHRMHLVPCGKSKHVSVGVPVVGSCEGLDVDRYASFH